MREIEAWYFCVSMFSQNVDDGMVELPDKSEATGLCRVLKYLLNKREINEDCFGLMIEKIDRSLPELEDFLFECDALGAIKRVEFCRQQIERLKKEEVEA